MALIKTTRGVFNVVADGPRDAPVLMFSNSLGTTLEMWQAQVKTLALNGQFNVIRYDTRGHGQSVITPGPYCVADLADDALAILDALEIRQVEFCGLSMGGMIGLWLAIHASARINRLVIANSAPQISPASTWNDRIALVRREGMASIAEGVAQRWFTADFIARAPDTVNAIKRMIVGSPLEGYVACCAAVRDFDVRESMGGIKSSVMVIAGDADPATPPELTRQISTAIAGSKFVSLPAAHLSNIECAAEFTRLLTDFLKR